MAAKPKIKFMGRSGGVIHVVTTKSWDTKNSKCVFLKKGHNDGVWKGKGLSPEAVLVLTGCSICKAHDEAKAMIEANKTPAQKRAESKERRDDTLRRAQAKPKGKPKKEKGEPKRRGPRGGDADARMKAAVEEHLAMAKENGWEGKAWESGTSEWTTEVHRSGEMLRLIYRDGRCVHSRVTLKSGVEVRLRNSANWRRHAEGKSKITADYQPRSRGGKKAAKAEVVEDSVKGSKLPFSPEDDDDTIIESLVGRRITWRNSVSKSLDSAVVPTRTRNCRITVHPKSERRIISFFESQGQGERGEMLGGERSVYVDKILRVK